ncbi:MAG: cell division septal protein FtsQ [Verrucomicrobiales bacterium]
MNFDLEKQFRIMKSQRHSLHANSPAQSIETTGPAAETPLVRRRKRKSGWLVALRSMLTGMLATIAISGAAVGLHQVFYENPDFAVRQIRIQTDGRLSDDRVLALAKIPETANIFSLDLAALQERLEAVSFIRSARIERHLPDRLFIQLEEREPIAWLSAPRLGIHPRGTGRHSILLDRDGVPMRFEELLGSFDHLPVVAASGEGDYPIGKPIPDESLRVASALIEWWVEKPALGAGAIQEIRQINDYSIQTEFEGGLAVTFGIRDLTRQLSNFDLILRHASMERRKVLTVNLIPRKNIPVRYASGPNPPVNLTPVSGEISRITENSRNY